MVVHQSCFGDNLVVRIWLGEILYGGGGAIPKTKTIQ